MDEKNKILLVDDESAFCNSFQAFMQINGFDCFTAQEGREGLLKLETLKPNVLVLDVLMPNMDGLTMLREMKNKAISIPCIVITSREKLKDLFDIDQVSRFVPKPFSMEKIRDVIEEVLTEEKEKVMSNEAVNEETSNLMAGKKILLIEDEVKLGENLKNYLEMKEFSVNHVTNGEDGLKQVEAFEPDIVISDIIMPEMDGYSMLKELKRKRQNVPVIILTGKDRLRDLFEVEGIEGFITKPFNLGEVESKVREVLSK